jgi:non-ribosomal peptide synthetase component F
MSREIGNGTITLPTSATPLSEREYRPLVIDFNKSAVDYPANKTIVELSGAQAGETPNQKALVFEGQRLTYGELDSRTSLHPHHLKGLGSDRMCLLGFLSSAPPR